MNGLKTVKYMLWGCMMLGFWVGTIDGWGVETSIIRLNNGARAIQMRPKWMNRFLSYPMLIALHGKKESVEVTCKKWAPVVDVHRIIVICPEGSDFEEGYIRHPVDDRKNIIKFKQYVEKRVRVNQEKSIVVGFSRGGNIALELGAIYPDIFPNIVSMFGFFNKSVARTIKRKMTQNPSQYQHSQFYVITGKDDFSEQNAILGVKTLRLMGVRSKLEVYPDIKHEIPSDTSGVIKTVKRWMF